MAKRKPTFSSAELVEMMNGDQEAKLIAARRIWTDWDVLDNKRILKEIAPDLYQVLQTTDTERSLWHVMLALGCLQYVPAISEIYQLFVETDSAETRGFAAEALARYPREVISDEILVSFWQVLGATNPVVVKVNILRALENYYTDSKDCTIANRLMQLLSGQDHHIVASQLIKLVGAIGCIEVTPNLVHLMVARRTELTIDAAASALDAIAKKNHFSSRKDLIRSFDSLPEGQN